MFASIPMIGPPDLSRLLEQFQPVAVRVFPDRCLNRRHKDSRCALCLACPTQAIRATDISVTAQAGACVGCGLCMAVCPTEAFAVAGPNPTNILRLAAQWSGQAIEAVCVKRSPLEQAHSDAQVAFLLPCLAWLSPPLLLALIAQGIRSLWLDDSPCETCILGSIHPALLKAVAVTNKLLRLMGNSGTVSLYTADAVRLGRPHKVTLHDPRQPAYSRRGFFGALRRAAAEALVTVLEEALPPATTGKPVHYLPRQRALLAAALPRLGQAPAEPVDTDEIPLAALAVAANCTACGLCAKLCPTGALDFRQDQASYVLDIRPLHCLGQDCHICRLICPVEAITLSSQVNLANILNGEPQVLRAGNLVPCTRCGEPTAQAGDEPVCHLCRLRERLAPLAGSSQ